MDTVTKSAYETQKIARAIARGVTVPARTRATVLALEGDLGAGKTTFTQGFARALGIKERVVSPTFVLMKIYALNQESLQENKFPAGQAGSKNHGLRRVVHVDCYRITHAKDFIHLGLKELLRDKEAIILIEWPQRIKKILPRDTIWIRFMHGVKQSERRIIFNSIGKKEWLIDLKRIIK